MPHWRKANPPSSEFKSISARCAMAVSLVVLGTVLLLRRVTSSEKSSPAPWRPRRRYSTRSNNVAIRPDKVCSVFRHGGPLATTLSREAHHIFLVVRFQTRDRYI